MANYGFLPSLDPHQQPGLPTESPLYNQLLEYNPINPSEIIGDLTKEWKISDDGLSVSFTLHENVKWHDGKDLTADDAAFSVNRMIEPGKSRPMMGALKASVVNAVVVDPNTIKVNLKFPSGSFLQFIAVDHMKIVPKHIVEQGIDINIYENIVGSGPFKIRSQIRGQTRVLERNPDYFKEGRPFVDVLEPTIYIGDAGTLAAAFKTGKILASTCCHSMAVEDTLRLGESLKGKYTVYFGPLSSLQMFYGNWEKDPWKDPRVTQALRLATDLQEFKDAFGEGFWDVGGDPFPRNSWWGSTLDEMVHLPGYGGVPGSPRTKAQDIADAKALLKEAGFDPPSKLGKRVMDAGNNIFQRDPAILWAEQLRRNLGIDMEVNVLDSAGQFTRQKAGDFDMNTTGYGMMIFDPDDLLTTMYGPKGVNFVRGPRWSNQWFADKIEEQSRELDVGKRKTILKEMEQYLINVENPYIIWVWKPPGSPYFVCDCVRTELGGYVVPDTIRTILKWEHVWVDKSFIE